MLAYRGALATAAESSINPTPSTMGWNVNCVFGRAPPQAWVDVKVPLSWELASTESSGCGRFSPCYKIFPFNTRPRTCQNHRLLTFLDPNPAAVNTCFRCLTTSKVTSWANGVRKGLGSLISLPGLGYFPSFLFIANSSSSSNLGSSLTSSVSLKYHYI